MNRIKLLREEFGYTQQDLANKLESSKSVIGLYESETRKPSLEVLIKLSEIFNCSIDYLLGKSDMRNLEKHDEPVIREIARGAKRMSSKDKEKMLNMIKVAFEEAFNEDSDNK